MFRPVLKQRFSLLSAALCILVLVSGCALPGSQSQPGQGQTPAAVTPTVVSCGNTSCVQSPVPGIRPFIDTWNNIHLFQSFDYDIDNPTAIARYYDFIWGATPSRVSAFRSANPNILLSYYIPFNRDNGTFSNTELGKQHDLGYWKAQHPDWILYQCDRTTPAFEYGDPNIPFDFSNPAVVAWQVQTYAQPASQNGYDAIAADNVNLENLFGACGFYKNGQWVQRYTGKVDDPQWRADVVTWLTRMQAALHSLSHPLALIPNLGLAGGDPASDKTVQQVVSHVDGILDEGGFTNYGQGYVTGTNWTQLVQFIKSVQQQVKPFYIVNQFDSNALSHEQIQWALASYLLAKGRLASVFITTTVNGVQGYGADRRRPEYSAPIGSPRSEIYQDQNVYWRDYSNGLVVVNPSNTNSYTVTTKASTYDDLYGNHVNQTFTLPPHSGMVLIPG